VCTNELRIGRVYKGRGVRLERKRCGKEKKRPGVRLTRLLEGNYWRKGREGHSEAKGKSARGIMGAGNDRPGTQSKKEGTSFMRDLTEETKEEKRTKRVAWRAF